LGCCASSKIARRQQAFRFRAPRGDGLLALEILLGRPRRAQIVGNLRDARKLLFERLQLADHAVEFLVP
jgi:hypothetical protein